MSGGIAYGGDWNPEQWPEETWTEDVALMREAGVTRVSVGIFSWALLEPAEGVYDFGWFDRALDLLAGAGVEACLATPTAAPPPWFGHAHPEALPVDADGRRLHHGSRQGFCPSSPVYRDKALEIAERVARRYAGHPALAMWHVHNEYGCHNARCYCDTSAAAFRDWLRGRHGTLEALNDAWGTAFWSQRYGDWEQILPPRATPSFTNPGQQLDFRRFSSDALVELYTAERDLLKKITPEVPVTTNLMAGAHMDMDCRSFAAEVDVVATDHYLIGEREEPHVDLAFAADYARSLNGGRPWLLMEHSTSAVNWQPRNFAKTPGELRRNSLAHLAREPTRSCSSSGGPRAPGPRSGTRRCCRTPAPGPRSGARRPRSAPSWPGSPRWPGARSAPRRRSCSTTRASGPRTIPPSPPATWTRSRRPSAGTPRSGGPGSPATWPAPRATCPATGWCWSPRSTW
nr:hypothetical protein GCM10020093_036300 [Planobispora longispora]